MFVSFWSIFQGLGMLLLGGGTRSNDIEERQTVVQPNYTVIIV